MGEQKTDSATIDIKGALYRARYRPDITITNEDIKYHWLTHAEQGLVVKLDEVQIQPQDFGGRVRYDPNSDGFAMFLPVSNEIVVGRKSIDYSEGLLAAFLRHERSHYTFANLTVDEQKRIAELFLGKHHADLEKFYQAIRTRYKEDYFKPDTARPWTERANQIGRGRKVVVDCLLWNGERLESVDLIRLIDELIAFGVTTEGGSEFLVDSGGWEPTFDSAREIIRNLDPELRAELDSHGFLNIEAKKLLQQLRENQEWVDAHIKIL